jgi:hypothetical protein
MGTATSAPTTTDPPGTGPAPPARHRPAVAAVAQRERAQTTPGTTCSEADAATKRGLRPLANARRPAADERHSSSLPGRAPILGGRCAPPEPVGRALSGIQPLSTEGGDRTELHCRLTRPNDGRFGLAYAP